ncbi:hypothetical protein CWS02_23010 [Enterobacter sp. EA-1]|nr:hypothetical protein CWS02_23010 [Enterobacter sp. EA-1]
MADITLTHSEREQLRNKLQAYCETHFELELEQFDAEFLSTLSPNRLAPPFYNAGIEEAIRTHALYSERIQEEMDLKRSSEPVSLHRVSALHQPEINIPFILHAYNAASFLSSPVSREGKSCRLSPHSRTSLNNSPKPARKVFSP